MSDKKYKHTAYVALGSNLQDPAMQIKKAFLALNNLPDTKLVKVSSLYLTTPVGYTAQPDFINAVAEINTLLNPLELLNALLNIETQAGRVRPFVNAPRVLDCDLLLYEDVIMTTQALVLPHPRMLERTFVLIPLAEIAPDLTVEMHGNHVKLSLLINQKAINYDGIKRLDHEVLPSIHLISSL